MTAYTAANMASGSATYRSAPQGAAVRSSTTTSRSFTTTQSTSSATKAPTKPAAAGETAKRK